MAEALDYARRIVIAGRVAPAAQTVTIASGQTVGSGVDGAQFTVAGLLVPAVFTGTAVTFQVSADGLTFVGLYDITGAAVSVAVVANRAYDLPGELMPWAYWNIVSNATEAGSRTLTVVGKGA